MIKDNKNNKEMQPKTINKIFILFIFLFTLSFESNASNNYEYNWTHNHPILIDYVRQNRQDILNWTPHKLNLSSHYEHFIYTALRAEGVPREILVLAGIESGFRTDVVSHAQAVGMWQFLEDTGREWGLEINEYKDERTDWRKSTISAARYLKWMAESHFNGNYEMAILAYNAGIGRIKRLSEELNTNDPWVIIEKGNLPQESREYLPKFLSFMHYYYHIKQ